MQIAFSGSAEDIFLKAKKVISDAGGVLNGDSSSGDFDVLSTIGAVTGNYKIQNNFISVDIIHRPFLISCSLIESTLRNYIANKENLPIEDI